MSRTPPGRGWRSLDVTAATTGPADLTDYIPDRILIAGHDRGSQLELLTAAAERRGWLIEPDPRFGVRGSSREESDHPLTRLLIVPGPGSPEPDAFELLELARAADLARFGAPDGNELGFVPGDEYEDPSAERRAGRRLEDRVPPELPSSRISLDHAVYLVAFHPNGKGIYGTNGKGIYGTNGCPADSYGYPGSGGHSPVAVVIDAPERGAAPRKARRRPAVGYLDSGCGSHPWLTDVVRDHPREDGTPVAPRVAGRPSPEEVPDQIEPLDGVLDAVSGHGTFIAGMIRQSAPTADIYSWRIVTSEGVIAESELTSALEAIADLVEHGTVELDVLSLSLGYYPERVREADNDEVLRPSLERLTRLGVSIVCSAGNDCTDRELYPAAHAARPPEGAPFISVGARNPNGTIALFSNVGAWVSRYEVGAALVSTSPPFQGGLQPISRVPGDDLSDGVVRESLDPDCFHAANPREGGFAVWSGTSFAAPRFAGRLARAIGEVPEHETDRGRIARAYKALKSLS
ncbi:S8 family serine peptidase [Salana multivorans]